MRKLEMTNHAHLVLKKALKHALTIPEIQKVLPLASLEVDLEFLSTPKMKKLYKSAFGKLHLTDVLSFPSPEPFYSQGQIGEIVISLEQAKKQAKAFGHPLKNEIQLLVIHGLLHLLGFDHERGPKAAKTMASLEKKLLPKSFPSLITRASLQAKIRAR